MKSLEEVKDLTKNEKQELLAFLEDWWSWATGPDPLDQRSPIGIKYDAGWGLCTASVEWSDFKGGPESEVFGVLNTLFIHYEDPMYPFGCKHYHKCSDSTAQHKSKRRLNWVSAMIKELRRATNSD